MDLSLTLSQVTFWTALILLVHVLALCPALEKALRGAKEDRLPLWAATLAAADTSKLIWMMLAVSALLTWTTIMIAAHVGGETVAAVQSAIDRVHSVRRIVVNLEKRGNLSLLIVATGALIFWIYRFRLRKISNVIVQLRQVQAEELIERFKEGTLPDLDPDERMKRLGNLLEGLSVRREEVGTALAAASNDSERAGLAEESAELQSRIEAAAQAYIAMDIERRIEVSPLAALEGDIPRPARTPAERLGRFLISRGLLRRLSWGQRALLLVNLLLAVPTALVAAQTDITRRLDGTAFELAELRVNWIARDRAAELKAAIERVNAQQQSEPSRAVSDNQIVQTANHIGHIFERGVGDAFAKQLRRPQTDHDADVLKARGDMRASKARQDILTSMVSDHPEGQVYVDSDPPKHAHLNGVDPTPPAGNIERIPGLQDSSTRAASALARSDEEPLTRAGRAMAREVREMMTASRAARDLFTLADTSFKEVVRPTQVANVLLSEIFSGTLHLGALGRGALRRTDDWPAAGLMDSKLS